MSRQILIQFKMYHKQLFVYHGGHPSAKQGKLDKHLCRAERKYSLAEKKLQEQKKKERQNKVSSSFAWN